MSTTKNDRDLLAQAAKAAGPDVQWTDYSDRTPDHWVTRHVDCHWREWNPLADDGDEARLEAKLRLTCTWYGNAVCVSVGGAEPSATEFFTEYGGDEQAARRYAGVRAAAAIGSAMP